MHVQAARQAFITSKCHDAVASSGGYENFNRGRIALYGAGRMGKTALARSIKGEVYEATQSTVGIKENLLEVSTGVVGAGSGSHWNKLTPVEREMEAMIARRIMVAAAQPEGEAGPSGAPRIAGAGGGAGYGDVGSGQPPSPPLSSP